MDRFGQVRVILPTALTSAVLLAGLALATTGGASDHVLLALAVGTGISYPAIGPALRSSFRIVLPDPSARRVAFALDATSVELAFVCGPLLLSALLLSGVAALPLLVTAGLLALGGLGYCLTGVARRANARTQQAAAGHEGPAPADGPRSALTSTGVPLVLAVMLVISIGFGQLDTSMAGTADLALGSTERVGILFAAIAGGSTLGGLAYGSRTWSLSERKAVPRLLAVFAGLLVVLAVLLATGTTQLVVLLPVLFLTGLTIAPTLIMQQALLDQLVPPARLNEAQAFLSASNTAGAALGHRGRRRGHRPRRPVVVLRRGSAGGRRRRRGRETQPPRSRSLTQTGRARIRHTPSTKRAVMPAVPPPSDVRLGGRLGAEFLGTFGLVFGGCGSAVLAAKFLGPDQVQLGIGFLGVALAFGLTVLTAAFAFGHVSGGHFNPAVTVGLAVAGRFGWREVLPYVVTQVVAASAAGGVLFVIATGSPTSSAAQVRAGGFATNGYGLHSPGGYGLGAALLTEIVLTAAFLYVILGATDDRTNKAFAPIAIGFALTSDPPDQHPGRQHLGEPGPLPRRRLVRRRRGAGPGLAVRPRPARRRGDRRCLLRPDHRRRSRRPQRRDRRRRGDRGARAPASRTHRG